jgi:hypothetical protein
MLRLLVFGALSLVACGILLVILAADTYCAPPQRLYQRAFQAFRSGDDDEILRASLEWTRCAPGNCEAAYDLACALARNAKRTTALDELERAADLRYDDPGWMEQDEDLALLRDDPRYERVLAQMHGNARSGGGGPIDVADPMPGFRVVEGFVEGGLHFRVRLPDDATADAPCRLVVWMHPPNNLDNDFAEELAPALATRHFCLMLPTQKRLEWRKLDATRLLATLPEARKVAGVRDAPPVLLGFGGGGEMALELWRQDPGRFGGVAVISAFPLDEDAYEKGRYVLFSPPDDPARRHVPLYAIVTDANGLAPIWRQTTSKWPDVPVTSVVVHRPLWDFLLDDRNEQPVFLDWLGAIEKPAAAD